MATPGGARRLRVGFDDQIFQAQHRGGISKYFVELLQRLPAHGIDPVLLVGSTRNSHLAESGLAPRRPEPGRVAHTFEWLSWRASGRPRTMPSPLPALDLMHHTFSHPAYLKLWRGPRVSTVYDMTPEVYPELFRLGNPHFAKRRYAERSDAIIAISQSTADDLARFYGGDVGERTTVIHLGVGESFFGAGPDPEGLPTRYLLFVGMRSGYKDFAVALEAYVRLAAEDPELGLVVVGGGPFTSEELRALQATGLAERVVRLAPTDAELPQVYRRAAAFVFPSRYEGFGLPTIEAFAAGTPVVLADASCSREVGGELARYFAPGDVDEAEGAIRGAISERHAQLIAEQGPTWARGFDWDVVAARTAEVYRRVAMPVG